MKNINCFTGVGRLTKDLEVSYTSGGTAIGNFTIAVNRSIKVGDQWQDKACFFDCVMFGKRNEAISQYLTKGTEVAVQGELDQDRWEKEGTKHTRVKIIVDNIQFFGSKKNGSGNGVTDNYQPPAKREYIDNSGNKANPPEDDYEEFIDDVPF